jgi:hypothetical protein
MGQLVNKTNDLRIILSVSMEYSVRWELTKEMPLLVLVALAWATQAAY